MPDSFAKKICNTNDTKSEKFMVILELFKSRSKNNLDFLLQSFIIFISHTPDCPYSLINLLFRKHFPLVLEKEIKNVKFFGS